MSVATDWITAFAALGADLLSLVAGIIAYKALRENRRAADEAKKSADAAVAQVNMMRPRPLVLAGFLNGINSRTGFTIRNVGSGIALDIEISTLKLEGGPVIETAPIPYLETGNPELGIHTFVNDGPWLRIASDPDLSHLQMFMGYFQSKQYNPDGKLALAVIVKYRSVTGESFQTDFELRLDPKLSAARLFTKGSLVGAVDSN